MCKRNLLLVGSWDTVILWLLLMTCFPMAWMALVSALIQPTWKRVYFVKFAFLARICHCVIVHFAVKMPKYFGVTLSYTGWNCTLILGFAELTQNEKWLIMNTLSSRKFQNVKLRLDFVEIWILHRHSNFMWNQILGNSNGLKMSFLAISETQNFKFWTWQLLKLTKIKIRNL